MTTFLDWLGFALRVGGLTLLVIAASVLVNWWLRGRPRPPDDFQ